MFAFLSRSAPGRVAQLTRKLPYLAGFAVILGAMMALGASPSTLGGFSGSFALGPDSLPAGTAGGSQLSVSSGGAEADLELWAPTGVPTYFLDVASFTVHAARATTVELSADLSSPLASLPAGGELLAYFGTPAASGSSGGSLSSLPSSDSGPLASIGGLGGAEAGFPGLVVGVEVDATGNFPLGSAAQASLAFSGAGSYVLVLSVGVVIPSSDPTSLEGTALLLSISLSNGL